MKSKLYKTVLSLSLILLTTSLFANDAEMGQAIAQNSRINWVFENIIFIMGGLIILGAILGIVRLNSQLLELQKIRLLEEHGLPTMEKLNLVPQESFYSRWSKKMTKIVPIEQEEDVMLDHEYDGIRELDNILPPWWVSLFKITVVMGVVYFGYYHMTDYGMSSTEEWEMEMADAKQSVKTYLATQSNLVDETSVTISVDAADLAKGKSIYTANCVLCHGAGGEGGIGPNFSDKYWIHGGDIKDLFRTIKYGVPEKGMISWKSQLKAGDMQKVASYILTLQGTNPPNAKAAEGELWEAPEGK